MLRKYVWNMIITPIFVESILIFVWTIQKKIKFHYYKRYIFCVIKYQTEILNCGINWMTIPEVGLKEWIIRKTLSLPLWEINTKCSLFILFFHSSIPWWVKVSLCKIIYKQLKRKNHSPQNSMDKVE